MARPFRERREEEDVFRALAHPIRRRIITAATDKPRSFHQLRELSGRSEATLAAHLRILREANVLLATRSGRSVCYQVNRRSLRSGAHWMAMIAASPARKAGGPG